MRDLDGDITQKLNIDGTASMSLTIDGEISAAYGKAGYEAYTGEYEVTPSTQEQTLQTSGKLMTDNVTIFEIPYYETSNVTGTTVYIANEV